MPKSLHIPYKKRPQDHQHHAYTVAREHMVYSRSGTCSACQRQNIPIIRYGQSVVTPGFCRKCLTTGIEVIEQSGRELGLALTGVPPVDPPPVMDVWLCRRKTYDILGVAQGIEEHPPHSLVLDSPQLFRPLDDLRMDVVVQMWEGAWGKRGLLGNHHVLRAKPHNLLDEKRFSIQLPADYDSESLELQIVG